MWFNFSDLTWPVIAFLVIVFLLMWIISKLNVSTDVENNMVGYIEMIVEKGQRTIQHADHLLNPETTFYVSQHMETLNQLSEHLGECQTILYMARMEQVKDSESLQAVQNLVNSLKIMKTRILSVLTSQFFQGTSGANGQTPHVPLSFPSIQYPPYAYTPPPLGSPYSIPPMPYGYPGAANEFMVPDDSMPYDAESGPAMEESDEEHTYDPSSSKTSSTTRRKQQPSRGKREGVNKG